MSFRAALLTLLASAIGAQAAKNVTVHASDASQISYFGSGWRAYSDCGGTMYSYAIGDHFSLSFTGTDVYLFGTVGTTGGVVTVTLDGNQTEVDRVDTVSYLCGKPVYSRTNLTNTRHNIMVNFTSQSPGLTTGYVDWQWIQYTVADDANTTSIYPTTVLPTTSISSTRQASSTGVLSGSGPTSETKKGINTAAIIGGVAGGVGAVALVAGLIFCLFRRKKAKKVAKQAEQMANSLPPGPSPMSFVANSNISGVNSRPSPAPQVLITTQQYSHGGFRGDHNTPITPSGHGHGPTSFNAGYSLPPTPYGNSNYTGSESGASLLGHQQAPAGSWAAQGSSYSLPQAHMQAHHQSPYNPGAASSSTVNQQPINPTNHYPMSPLSNTTNSSAYGPPPGLSMYPSQPLLAPHSPLPSSSISSSSHTGSGSGVTRRSEKSRHVANPEPAQAPAPAYSSSTPLGEDEVNRIAARVVESLRVGSTASGPSGSNSSPFSGIPDLENDPAQLAANIREAAAGRYDAPPTYDNKR